MATSKKRSVWFGWIEWVGKRRLHKNIMIYAKVYRAIDDILHTDP